MIDFIGGLAGGCALSTQRFEDVLRRSERQRAQGTGPQGRRQDDPIVVPRCFGASSSLGLAAVFGLVDQVGLRPQFFGDGWILALKIGPQRAGCERIHVESE